MRLAIATCRDLPEWDADEQPLREAFERRGVDVRLVPWDAPAGEWDQLDACLIRTTWDYAPRRTEFCAWAERVSQVLPLFNPAEIVRWNTHKSYLRELEASGITTVPTAWLERGGDYDLESVLERLGSERAVLKPAVGATAREILCFGRADLDPARAHVARLLPEEDLLLQPYLPTVETRGEISVIFVDAQPTHGVRKTPASGEYRVQNDFGGRAVPWPFERDRSASLAPVRAWLAARPELLYARADYLEDEEGRLLLNELELVEPSLFFRHAPEAAETLADALLRRMGSGSPYDSDSTSVH